MANPTIKVKKFHDNAQLPMRMTEGANGYDVFLPYDVVIPPSVVLTTQETRRFFLTLHDSSGHIKDEVITQKDLIFDHSADRYVNIGRLKVNTGVGLELPQGLDCSTRGRSGCAAGKEKSVFAAGGLDMFLGTIDMDFRGEICLIMFNFSPFPLPLKAGERIGQLIFTKIESPTLEWADELSETARGEGGFGHTDLGDKKS
jgi:dUTP pyrophosphatase